MKKGPQLFGLKKVGKSWASRIALNSLYTGCFTPIGVYKKLATLNPENITVNVISIDI
jgi:porphobilinogen deaminase